MSTRLFVASAVTVLPGADAGAPGHGRVSSFPLFRQGQPPQKPTECPLADRREAPRPGEEPWSPISGLTATWGRACATANSGSRSPT